MHYLRSSLLLSNKRNKLTSGGTYESEYLQFLEPQSIISYTYVELVLFAILGTPTSDTVGLTAYPKACSPCSSIGCLILPSELVAGGEPPSPLDTVKVVGGRITENLNAFAEKKDHNPALQAESCCAGLAITALALAGRFGLVGEANDDLSTRMVLDLQISGCNLVQSMVHLPHPT